MPKKNKIHTLEQNLKSLVHDSSKSSLTIQEILHRCDERGQILLLLVLSLPFCLPIQIPGLSTVFGIVIVLIGFSLISKKSLWLPNKYRHKKVSFKVLQKIVKKSLWILNKANRFLYPRLNSIANKRKLHGIWIIVLGVYLALPIPIPLSNVLVAISLVLISLGLLEDDGLWILFSYIFSLISLAGFIWMLIAFSFF